MRPASSTATVNTANVGAKSSSRKYARMPLTRGSVQINSKARCCTAPTLVMKPTAVISPTTRTVVLIVGEVRPNSCERSRRDSAVSPKKREMIKLMLCPVSRCSTADSATTSGAVHSTCCAHSASAWVSRSSSRMRLTPCPAMLWFHQARPATTRRSSTRRWGGKRGTDAVCPISRA